MNPACKPWGRTSAISPSVSARRPRPGRSGSRCATPRRWQRAGRLPPTSRTTPTTLSRGWRALGGYVRLVGEHRGRGMGGAPLSGICEPVFATEEVGQGSGLGLALVYAMVTGAGGAIDVKTAPKPGRTFTIYLTRAD